MKQIFNEVISKIEAEWNRYIVTLYSDRCVISVFHYLKVHFWRGVGG